MFKTLLSIAALAFAIAHASPAAAQSSPVDRAIADGSRHINESRQIFLRSLTPRQRVLLQRIEAEENAYQTATGCAIPLTRPNLATLMARIGAAPSDASFVHDRMLAAVKLDGAFNEFDAQLAAVNAQTCQTLGLFCNQQPIATCRSRR
jgi:hypothetical protein